VNDKRVVPPAQSLFGDGPQSPPLDPEEETDMAITIYSKPNCVQCTATYRAMDKAVTKGVFHRNNGANKKSKMANAFNKMS